MIRVQVSNFEVQAEYERLTSAANCGATAMFVGRVRDFAHSSGKDFHLEHYPGMTEKVLTQIERDARKRWSIHEFSIIHRVGKLEVNEQIVFVGVSSAHRADAFDACQYAIDVLKTSAPFWKKEGDYWVEAQTSDVDRAEHWLNKT